MNTNLFKKIIVNDNEIELDQLYANNGVYQLPEGTHAIVKFFFNDEVTKIIPAGVFDNNTQITKVTLSEEIKNIENGAFSGCENLDEESKDTIEDINEEAIIEVVTKTYTIIFKDGDIIVSTITGETGTSVSNPILSEKEGYEFLGWSIDGENIIIPVNSIGDADITYIAIWKEIQQGGDEPEEPKTKYYFSYGQTEITTDNYTTVNDAQEIEEYPEESTYEAPATGYVYVLVKNDKTVQFADPSFNDADITTVDTEANIEGYKVYRSAKIVETGIIKIKIS